MNRNEIAITEKIRCIPASEDPLCADIGIVEDNGITWLFDVGNWEKQIAGLNGEYYVVLSHFHQDHVGNLDRIPVQQLYLSRETYDHVHRGTVVRDDLYIGNLHIFPLPSSHTRGCLGLEVDGTYAFVGDGLYCRSKNGCYFYNAQLLKDEIAVLKNLRASLLLVSHYDGLVRRKEDVISELEEIYSKRQKDSSQIILGSL